MPSSAMRASRILLRLLALPALLVSCDRTPSDGGGARVASVRVEPAADTLPAGALDTLRATPLDAGGRPVAGVRVAWSSSDSAVATVDSGGTVTGQKVGAAVIRAATGAVWGEAQVTVIAPKTSCQASGTIHDGTAGSPVWRAADSPHRVTGSISVQGLTIEAGALVCLAGGARLSLDRGTLIARGTATAPVVLTATDPALPWNGIYDGDAGGSVRLSHVLLENATIGVRAGGVEIDSSHIRQIHASAPYTPTTDGTAVMLVSGRVLDTTIDTADAAVWPANWNSRIVLDGSVLRGGGTGTGVYCRRWGSVTLRETRIEGFALGIDFEEYTGDCTIPDATGARLTRNGRSAHVPLNAAAVLLAQAGPDSLRGNRSDTLQVFGGAAGDIVIPAGIPVAGSNLQFSGSGALRLLPGASFTFSSTCCEFPLALGVGQRLLALGTAAAPIELVGDGATQAVAGGGPGGPSQLTHVEVRGFHLLAPPGRPMLVDSSHFSAGASLLLRAAGSHLVGSLVEDAVDSAAVVLGADSVQMRETVVARSRPTRAGVGGTGVRIESVGVVVTGCTISGSVQDGIRVTGGAGAHVNHCNLVGNAGAGLNNLTGVAVDARSNWWGDSGGPGAAGADRAVGNVDFTPWATTPFALGPSPASIFLAPSSATVSTADTVRFQAFAQDAAGARLDAVPVALRVADTSAAVLDPRPGLVVGVRAGSTMVRASAVGYPDVSAAAGLTVTPGGPVLTWTQDTTVPGPGAWRSAWGSSPSDVYLAAGSGLSHFDGRSWSRISDVSGGEILDVWGRSASEVYASRLRSNQQTDVLRYDGRTWTTVAVVGGQVWAVWADSSGELFAVGDSLWHVRSGQVSSAPTTVSCFGVWGRSARDVYAACTGGVRRFDGSGWTVIGGPLLARGVWGTDSTALAVGADDKIQEWDGRAWKDMVAANAGWLEAVAGVTPSSVWAAGRDGVIRYYDGSRWWPVWGGATEAWFWGVAAVGNEVYVVGTIVLHGRPR